MVKKKSPKVLWDYCLTLASLVRSNIAHNIYQLKCQVPETIMMARTSDISHICEYEWYEWLMYHEEKGYPEDKAKLGRYLGPTEPGIGSVMSYYVLQYNGEVVTKRTIRKLTPQEQEDKTVLKEKQAFDEKVTRALGDPMLDQDLVAVKASRGVKVTNAVTPEYEAYEDDQEYQKRIPDADDLDPETYDEYILAQVQLPRDDEHRLGTVIRRAKGENERPIGRHNQNPLLDTRIYEFEFSDGQVLEYAANVIAENLYSQVDEEGHQQVMLDKIVDHKSDNSAVLPDDSYTTLNGRRHRRITTKGWKLCAQWKDGSTSWEPLSYPVQTAEYAIANKLKHQPAFVWWAS
jgi:hypothetical protein